jgi:DNA transformation protein and related proteins
MRVSPMRFSDGESGLASLRNLGPKSAAVLARVGLNKKEDLLRVGGIGAYQLLKEKRISVSKNMAYAIEAALMDVDWRALPFEFKLEINTRIAAYEAKRSRANQSHTPQRGQAGVTHLKRPAKKK